MCPMTKLDLDLPYTLVSTAKSAPSQHFQQDIHIVLLDVMDTNRLDRGSQNATWLSQHPCQIEKYILHLWIIHVQSARLCGQIFANRHPETRVKRFCTGRNKHRHKTPLVQRQQQQCRGRVYVSTHFGFQLCRKTARLRCKMVPREESTMSGVVGILEPHGADEDLVVMSLGVFSTFKITQISILAHVPDMLTLLSTGPEELLT